MLTRKSKEEELLLFKRNQSSWVRRQEEVHTRIEEAGLIEPGSKDSGKSNSILQVQVDVPKVKAGPKQDPKTFKSSSNLDIKVDVQSSKSNLMIRFGDVTYQIKGLLGDRNRSERAKEGNFLSALFKRLAAASGGATSPCCSVGSLSQEGHRVIQISRVFRGFPMLQLPYQFGRSGMDRLNIPLGSLVLTLLCGIHARSTLGITSSSGWNSSQNPTTSPTSLPPTVSRTSIETEWFHVLSSIGYSSPFVSLFPISVSISSQD
ncbi:putative cytochrome c biogenesis ccmB-like mitochondrial protein [Capsicum annuum]|uniref:Cytochrome c biogenesis ccmB-like mitochondrial protein n=1 Tax=Capsicum annuum TaxID=4072 RepID=A0A2G2YXD5_CAPAN|nr:putative cytochrome c biogenesis ccmB-like mitochondrial protein [Capsicum annuum]